ncbi:GumC domain-containing protein [Sphingobacterium paucimobilis]|nr:lipopolysaccharide biosynthesis protein [Sphingobacterium paucimobilis]
MGQEEISLKELILKLQSWSHYLLSKWLFLLIAGILGGTIGFLYAHFKKPVYTAITTFVLESGDQAGGALSQYAGMAAMVGIDLGGGSEGLFQGENILELYKSRKMIEAALLKSSISDSTKLLLDCYLKLSDTQDKWKSEQSELVNVNFRDDSQKELKRVKDSIIQGAVLDINKEYLQVEKLDKKLSIIKVNVKSENEVFSKEFNEALVKEVNDFYVETKTKKSLDNIKVLEQKTDSVRAVMNANISTAASIIDATPNLNPTRQSQRLGPTQKSQFSIEANKAILGHLVQNLELSKMALMKETPLIQVVDEPRYPLEKASSSRVVFSVLVGFLFVLLTSFYFIVQYILRDIGVLENEEKVLS